MMRNYLDLDGNASRFLRDDGSTVPADPNNMDYVLLLKEITAGKSEVRDRQGVLVDMTAAIAR
jgi:hypothetical protein